MSQAYPDPLSAPGSSLPPLPYASPKSRAFPKVGADALLKAAALTGALCIVLMLAALLIVLFRAALPSIHEFGLRFLISSEWRPNALEQPLRGPDGKIVFKNDEMVMQTIPEAFGALPVIYGTAISSALALLFAVPLSLGAALFLVRVAPDWLKPPVSFLIEFLAAIPSIAYGLWGLFILAPFLQGSTQMPTWIALLLFKHSGGRWIVDHLLFWAVEARGTGDSAEFFFRGIEPILQSWLGNVPGFGWLFESAVKTGGTTLMRPIALTGRNMLCGSLVLAIMIVPIITAISRDVLRQVPRAQVEGSVALGATWWQSCAEMLKYSRSGLFGAVMLGLARAAGETMAVTMVIGNNNQIVASPFAPAQTMSSLLANEFAEASSAIHRAALCEVALILLVMSLVFNVVARWLVVGKGSRSAAAH